MGSSCWTHLAVSAITAVLAFTGSAQAQSSLTSAEVGRVIAQAAQEATARGRPATIAVTDRVGNVLGVFRMTGANNADSSSAAIRNITVVNNSKGANFGLNGVSIVPDTLAAISKAVTGAYLSSGGNAFTTRTASQIVQEHFDPGERDTPSGPLFGVQFSQLPCTDILLRSTDGMIGPKRSPLGLAADSGGLPLYKGFDVVGGIGVIADASYGLDEDIHNKDFDIDELIAVAGEIGFEPPEDIRERITAGGKTLRFSDVRRGDLASSPESAPAFASVNGTLGALVTVNGYYSSAGGLLAGTEYGTAASGVRRDVTTTYSSTNPPVLLVDAANNPRFPPRGGSSVGTADLTALEVQTILRNAYQLSQQTRAQIRRPVGTPAQVNFSVVDANGTMLGFVGSPDAPIFGIDVSAQKARSALWMSSSRPITELTATPMLNFYLAQTQFFFGSFAALNGGIAFSTRAIGNLARTTYPDGIDNTINGPFALPPQFGTVFATGLQLDLVLNNIVQNILFVRGASTTDTAVGCTSLPAAANGRAVLANGLQIFPGGFPIYRGNQLIGAIGISGDGVDQDDLIGFLGLARASQELGTGFGHAPPEIRSDNTLPLGVRLRYVSCPFAALIDQRSSNLCNGL